MKEPDSVYFEFIAVESFMERVEAGLYAMDLFRRGSEYQTNHKDHEINRLDSSHYKHLLGNAHGGYPLPGTAAPLLERRKLATATSALTFAPPVSTAILLKVILSATQRKTSKQAVFAVPYHRDIC
jgi:hypothetical protein